MKRRIAPLFVAVIACGITGCTLLNELDASRIIDESALEICDNTTDDDGDEIVDCADPDCFDQAICQESSELACMDRRDNDADGRADCEDDACFGYFHCFPVLPFTRAPRCPPARPRYEIQEHFGDDGLKPTIIDESTWDVFYARDSDRPVIRDVGGFHMLQVGGRNAESVSGIASRRSFGVGSKQPFDLEVSLMILGACSAPDEANRCNLAIDLHTRELWAAGAEGGESIFGLELSATEVPGRLQLSCAYHERALEVTAPASGIDTGRAGSAIRLRILGSDDDTIKLFINGELLCEARGIQELEPETRLVFRSSRDTYCVADGECEAIAIDEIDLAVRGEILRDECKGRTMGRGILDDAYCVPLVFYNKAMTRPKVVHVESGYNMLFNSKGFPVASDFLSAVGHAVSRDDRKEWKLTTNAETAAFDPSPGEDRDRLGGLVLNRTEDRLEAWAEDRLFVAEREPGTQRYSRWSPMDARVTVEAIDDNASGPGSRVPESVVIRDGRYEAWYSAPSASNGGRSAIYRAVSTDRLTFRTHPAPVLSGNEGEWDLEGVYGPSVVWNGSYYLMAYTAKRFFAAPAIGLAASRDGIEWVRHSMNPVIVGEDDGLDDGGAAYPSISIEEGVLRVWYTASTFSVRTCGDYFHLNTGEQTRLALLELELPRTSTIAPSR
jgi:hypothetical protein